jgi:hypothetical protein
VTAHRLALAAAALLVGARAAAQVPPVDRVTPLDAEEGATTDEPDVVLDVPRAKIDKLALDVENLQARLDIDTRVANLVQINAGVVATVQKLKMELDGVETQAHLVVRLDRVANVLERALAVIDAKPDLAGQGSAPVATAASNAAATAAALGAPLTPGAAAAAASAAAAAESAAAAARGLMNPVEIAPVAPVQPVVPVAGAPAAAVPVATPIPAAPVAASK